MITLPSVLPPNVKYVDPRSQACSRFEERGAQASQLIFAADHPAFLVYQPEFCHILGQSPSLRVVAQEDSYPFAHEAGVWIPSTREVFFTSNQFFPEGSSKKKIHISKLSIPESSSLSRSYSWTVVTPNPDILTANGATNYKDGLIVCSQGQDNDPGALVYMNSVAPYESKILVNNFNGRPFNAPNDVVVLPLDGTMWFTDPHYGVVQGLRTNKNLPNQVYCYNPITGAIRVVADGFRMPNGIVFSPDYKICYITDTDCLDGFGGHKNDGYATIYAFDLFQSGVDKPYKLVNRRVFAFADSGAPDGIKCDTSGNVYSGCEDGINVWNDDGILVGKIIIPGGVANFCFTDAGVIIAFNENRIFEVRLNPTIKGTLPIE
jgi:gluconolactonase